MATWNVSAEMTISVQTEVEADTEEEARAIAEDRGVQGLCLQCAGGEPTAEWITSGELDGQPMITRLEKQDAPHRRNRR
jgi:hypothetical protein